MRNITKLFIFFVIGITLYFTINSIFSNSSALNLYNIFIPSEANYNYLEYQGANIPTGESLRTFNEFTEDTIDKNGFYIRIDKIKLFKMIVKDVDPRYQEVYKESWKTGISHGKFTAYPDQIGLTYLFSHAVSDKSKAIEQNAWFSYMDELTIGDIVYIYYQGKKYQYEVTQIRFVSPDATGFYTGASATPMLRMQYCGPPTGSLNSRTLVDAIRINVYNI